MSEPRDEAEVEAKRMPLLEHLVELRRRLVYSLAGFVVAFFVAFYFSNEIFNFLVQPLADLWKELPGKRLIYTAMQEKFFTDVRVAMFAAGFISFPVVASQIWMFIAPGLYRNERRAFLPFLLATPVLFLIGAAFVYYAMMPMAWRFFAGFQQVAQPGELAIELEPKVNEYLSLVMGLIFAFGICFELPVVISLLARVGMATPEGLVEKRRYAVVLAFVAAAILTPPDPLSMLSLAVPIVILYEISIVCAKLIVRRAAEAAAADA